MTAEPTRDQFLSKLRELEMTLTMTTRPFHDGEPDESRGVLHWCVSGDIELFDWPESEQETALWSLPGLGLTPVRQVEAEMYRMQVFRMDGMTVELARVRDAWGSLDARDADSSQFVTLIDHQTGYLRDDLSDYDDAADAASSLVIIDRAQVADGWRGQGGIGRLLIEQAIALVAEPAGLAMVALEAHPFLAETEDQSATPESIASTERTWTSMGFARVDRGKLFIRSTANENLFDEVAERLGLI